MAADADPPDQGDFDPRIDRSAGESCDNSTDATGADPTARALGPTARALGPTARALGPTDLALDRRPETRRLARIALLEARVATLEARLEAREADLRHVIDRYERVLQGRERRHDPLVADEFDVDRGADRSERDRADRDRSPGALDRLRGLLR